MIDVPVEAKEAFREGSHKKNYEFEVYREETIRHIVDVGSFDSSHTSFSVTEEARYILYNTENTHPFDYYEVIGSTARMDVCPVGETETWLDIGTCYPGDTITIYGLSAVSVGITITANVTYTKEWAYDFTMDNDNLVKESVSIDERLCSGDTLKFGLCEGSSLEFQYFDKENIKGGRIKAAIEMADSVAQFNIAYSADIAPITITQAGRIYFEFEQGEMVTVVIHRGDTAYTRSLSVEIPYGQFTCQVGDTITIETPSGYEDWILHFYSQGYKEVFSRWSVSIPMGYFTVEKCSRQASTGIIKATCYNKLQSDYLDAKANEQIDAIIAQGEDGSSEVSLYTILKDLLGDYSIEEYTETSQDVPVLGGYAYNVDTVQDDSRSGYYAGYTVTCSIPLSNLDYYKYTTELALLKAKISSLLTGYYVYVNGNRMSLTEYAKSNYLGSHHFGGRIHFNNEILFPPNILSQPDFLESDYRTNDSRIDITIPVVVEYTTNQNPTVTDAKVAEMDRVLNQWLNEIDFSVTLIKKELSTIEKYRVSAGDIATDVTLRDLQSAVYEIQCQFGQLDRETDLFSGVELGSDVSEAFTPSQYETLWADEQNVRKWRYLIITYKGLDGDGNEAEFTLQRTINADGTDDYNCSDNWLFRNLIWTAQQLGPYASAMVDKMRNITWFPFEMWAAGLPYLETGDKVEMTVGEEDYTSYILQRQLKGIQNLQDTYINGTLDIY